MQLRSFYDLLYQSENYAFEFSEHAHELISPDVRLRLDDAPHDAASRRILHTIDWCKRHKSSHSYDQVIFDFTENPADILFRHLSFHYEEHAIRINVSKRQSYVNSVIASNFESSLFDAMSDAVLITEADPYDLPGPKVVYCNRTFNQMTGYPSAEILGRTPRILQGEQTTLESRRNIRVGLSKWQKVKQRIFNYNRAGELFEVELNISPVSDATGWYSHWISVQREVSDHKQILDYFQHSEFILNASKTASWYLNFSKDGLFWDNRMYRLHNVEPTQSAIEYYDWLDCVFKDDRYPLYKAIENVRHSSRELDISYRVEASDGTVRWLRVRAELMKDQDEMRILCGICFDITAEKAAQEQIENHRKKAEQNAKLASLGELAAGVGHEINNPLSVIVASIDLAELELENSKVQLPRVKSSLIQMREASDRVARIVSGLRNVSSVGREYTDVAVANLSSDIEKTIQMLAELYSLEGIQLSFTPEAVERSFVKVDPTGLQQVVVNLLSNAKDAVAVCDKKIINVWVESNKNTCSLHVSDSGVGIDDRIRDRIFEPFVTMKDIGKGTGLGLSISKNIVESCGGSLRFTSEPGQGSCFSCEFIRASHPSQDDQKRVAVSSCAKVLLVEDDELVARSVTELLASFGCEVVHKANGKVALEWLQAEQADLILTDLKMPVMDGFELIQTINKQGLAENALTFLMTGDVLTMSEYDPRLLNTLVDGILAKPLKRIELAKLLNKLSKHA